MRIKDFRSFCFVNINFLETVYKIHFQAILYSIVYQFGCAKSSINDCANSSVNGHEMPIERPPAWNIQYVLRPEFSRHPFSV